jgi:hypothetical protein
MHIWYQKKDKSFFFLFSKHFKIVRKNERKKCLCVCKLLFVPGIECFEYENKGDMLVTDTIFGMWDFVVANDIDIRNRSRNNIAVRRICCADLKKLISIENTYSQKN